MSRPLTVTEAADELGYSAGTVYRMIRDREIGVLRRRGLSIRIEPEEIAAYKERCRCPALASQNPTTSSFSGPAGVNGTSVGPTPSAASLASAAQDAKIVSMRTARNGPGR